MILIDVQRNDRASSRRRGFECRIVGNAKILAEPDDQRFGRHRVVYASLGVVAAVAFAVTLFSARDTLILCDPRRYTPNRRLRRSRSNQRIIIWFRTRTL